MKEAGKTHVVKAVVDTLRVDKTETVIIEKYV